MGEFNPDRFQVIEDGPARWVLVDNESDDPAPVYETREEAEAAMMQRGLEAMASAQSISKSSSDDRMKRARTIDREITIKIAP